MNTSYQKTAGSDEWYTPRWITRALGHFDLDPCAAPLKEWRFADKNFTKEDDGLARPWSGRVFCNPPYSKPLFEKFCRKMVEHNNGILLVFNRLDTRLFQDVLLPAATAILFIRGRLRFSDERRNAGCGSILLAYGGGEAETLRESNIEGFYIRLR